MKSHLTLALFILSAASGLHAQGGSLTPPSGPPMPVMRTLTEIYDKAASLETRIPISSLPGTGTAKHLISLPGHYYLTGDLYGQSTKSGIRVDAYNVTIDLNGFTIYSTTGSTKGIEIYSGGPVIIRNGHLFGWPQQSIYSGTSTQLTVQDVTIQAGHNAIDFTGGGLIERVSILNAVGFGIRCPTVTQLLIRDCQVRNISDATAGILAPKANVSGCAVNSVTGPANDLAGIDCAGGIVQSCVINQVANTTGAQAYGVANAASVTDCSISDISTSQGFSNVNVAGGIESADQVARCTVKNIHGAGTCMGINSEIASNCEVQDVANGGLGILAYTISACRVTNVIGGTGLSSWRGSAPRGSSITGCTVHNCSKGILPNYGANVSDNAIAKCSVAGISCEDSGVCRIIGNTVDGGGTSSAIGIKSATFDASYFEGNTVSDCSVGYKAEGFAVFVRNYAASNCPVRFAVHASMPIASPTALGTNPNANIAFP